MESQSLFQNVVFDNVGPTVMSGRVVDVDVNPENPIEFYVGLLQEDFGIPIITE